MLPSLLFTTLLLNPFDPGRVAEASADALGIPVSPHYRALVARAIPRTIARGEADTIQNLLNWHASRHEKHPVERDAVLLLHRLELLTTNRARAAQGDPDAQWVLDAYSKAFPTVAQGAIPLTRDIAAAMVDLKSLYSPLPDRQQAIDQLIASWPQWEAPSQRVAEFAPAALVLARFLKSHNDAETLPLLKQIFASGVFEPSSIQPLLKRALLYFNQPPALPATSGSPSPAPRQ